MMAPTTFDMPDAIDESADAATGEQAAEQHEYQGTDLSEEQASDEPTSELGRVEDAEPGQDWNAEGVFIGAAEIIEVPFRRTVKSKATVRVVYDMATSYWRSGWHWKSLLKNDSGKISEVGKELSREFIGYASKAEAVHDALNHMASHAAEFDKRIGQDILKFRDVNWRVADASEEADDAEAIAREQQECQELADGTGPRHPDEPKANEHGIFDTDVETVAVALPKSCRMTAEMELSQDSHGWWRFGHNYRHANGGSGAMPRLKDDRFPSRKQAQLAALRHAIGYFKDIDLKVADKIAVLLGTTEQNATEIITAHEPATDPETKAAIDELGIAGIGVGEPVGKTPPTEAELQAKAERAFKKRMREATDHLADCVLARVDAEAVFKTAKAEEKAATEVLRSIADRGPERLPLFEAAQREQAKATVTDHETGESVTATFSREKPSDAWKSASVTELNLPKGVESKLLGDGIDTIGRLEQRRADVAMKKEKYPAGIGKAAIDKIEDAVLAWLKVNQHPDQATEVEPVEVPAEAAAAAEATTDKAIDPEIGDVAARLDELYGDVDFMCERTNGSYKSGREAYDRGDLLTDCPLTPGDEQDQWLMGWADAKEADRELE